MNLETAAERARHYLHTLCETISNRAVGSPGNRQAAETVAQLFAAHGWQVRTPGFDCLHWQEHGCTLQAGGSLFTAQVSPYSNGGTFHAPLAIIATTTRDPEMTGALYPFPLFEDGDFDIPSVFLTGEEGSRRAQHTGSPVRLDIRARREPARGCNVVARRGAQAQPRVVFFAHLDAKAGTPGALDNAAGVTVLLLLAELLAAHPAGLGVELVALNGEDYYSNPGEMLYLSENDGRFSEICLGINIDGAGYRQGGSAYSLYECPPRLADGIRAVMARHTGLVEGEPWVQGDHALFLMNSVPALAITSERMMELLATLVHTAADTPEQVDARRLAQTALALRDMVTGLPGWL